ncbi:MFS transporter [Herbidospora sp. RD11066]
MRARVTYIAIRGTASFAGSTAFTLNLVYQAQTAGLSALQMVLVGTVLETVCFLAQVPTGVLADLRSRRLSVIIGYLLFGAGFLVEGLFPFFGAILAANVVWGIGATFVDGAQEAWIVDEVGPDRASEVLVSGAQAGQAGAVLGIGGSVALAGFGLNVPILVGAAVWVVLGLVLIAVMPEDGFRPVPDPASWRAMRAQAGTALAAVRAHRGLLLLLAALACTAFASEGLDRLSQLHFLDDIGLPATGGAHVWFGLLAASGMIGAIGATQVIRRAVDLRDPRRTARAMALLRAGCVGATVVFALAGSFWAAAVASVVLGLLRAATGPLEAAWLAGQTESATRATVYSLFSQVNAAGQVVGGPPLGLLAERLGVRAALLGAAAVTVPAIGFLVASGRNLEAAQD